MLLVLGILVSPSLSSSQQGQLWQQICPGVRHRLLRTAQPHQKAPDSLSNDKTKQNQTKSTGHCFFFCTKGSGLVQPLSQLFHPGVALPSSILAAQLEALQTVQHFLHFGSFLVPVKSIPVHHPPFLPRCWMGW